MPEEWLLRYYETGENDHILLLISHYGTTVDRFLSLSMNDMHVPVDIWLETIQQLRDSRKHPELHWDLKRGSVPGFILAIAGSLMYRWLVWFDYPDASSPFYA